MGWPASGKKRGTDKKDAAKYAGAVARDTLAEGPPADPADYFKGGSTVRKAKGLRVGFWGDAKQGKTHCALTFPKPIYIVDTEFGTYPLLEKNHPEFWQWLEESGKVPEDQIKVFEAAVLDEESGEPDPLLSLGAIESSLTALQEVQWGTIVIDSHTDIWQFISTWLEEVAIKRSKDTGDKYRFEWGKANARYRLLMMRLLTKKNVNFIVTAQTRNLYDSEGKETSSIVPLWQKKTEHWVDLVIQCMKGSDQVFRGRVDACRLGSFKNAMINPPTYENIVEWIKKECQKDQMPCGWTTLEQYLKSLESVDERIEEVIANGNNSSVVKPHE